MIKMNKHAICFFLSLIALVGMSFSVAAQTAAPGTTSQGATVNDVLNQAQKNEADRINSSKGDDSGDNYHIWNAAGDAASDAWDDVSSTYDDANQKVQEKLDKGNIFGASWEALKGVVKTGASFSLGSIRTAFNFFGNLDMTGQDIYVYTDPYTGEQKKYVKTVFGGASATQGNLKGCPPLPIAVADASSCIFCPLFAVLYGAAQEMAELSFSGLGQPMAMVMLVGFALYVAFKVLAHVSSFTRQDAPSFINDLLIQSFKVLLAFLFLMNPDQIYYYFISPVLSAGLEFGTAMLFQASDMAKQCPTLTVDNDTALLPVTLYAKLDCYVRSVHNEIAVTQAIGSSLMCAGRNAAAGEIFGLWDFGMVFQGLIIWAFALMLSLAFAFYLMDSVVTLGIVGALMPFLIACWPFKLTNKYSKTGIELFLNVFFTFVFMGIVVSVNTQLLGQAMNGSTTEISSSSSSGSGSSSQTSEETTSGDLNSLAEVLSGDNIKKLKEMTDLGFGGFLIILFCCIFGFKFSNQSSTLANKMAGGTGISLAPGIGGLATKGATNVAKKATQPARKALANKAGEVTSKAGSAVASKLGLGKFGGKTGANKASGGAGGGGGTPAPTGGAGGGNGGAGAGNGGVGGAGSNTQNRQSPTEGGGNKDDLRSERSAGGNGGAGGGNNDGAFSNTNSSIGAKSSSAPISSKDIISPTGSGQNQSNNSGALSKNSSLSNNGDENDGSSNVVHSAVNIGASAAQAAGKTVEAAGKTMETGGKVVKGISNVADKGANTTLKASKAAIGSGSVGGIVAGSAGLVAGATLKGAAVTGKVAGNTIEKTGTVVKESGASVANTAKTAKEVNNTTQQVHNLAETDDN